MLDLAHSTSHEVLLYTHFAHAKHKRLYPFIYPMFFHLYLYMHMNDSLQVYCSGGMCKKERQTSIYRHSSESLM